MFRFQQKKSWTPFRLRCNLCGEKLWGSNNLKNHMVNHDEASLECLMCLKMFTKSTISNHFSEVHSVITCTWPNCNSRFSSNGGLKIHISLGHGNKELCVECGEGFRDLKYHQRTLHQASGIRHVGI